MGIRRAMLLKGVNLTTHSAVCGLKLIRLTSGCPTAKWGTGLGKSLRAAGPSLVSWAKVRPEH